MLRDIPFPWTERLSKDQFFPNFYRLKTVSIKIPVGLFGRNWQAELFGNTEDPELQK